MKRPILYVAVFFCLGILSSRILTIPIVPALILCAVFILLALFLSKNRVLSHIVLYAAIFIFGLVYYKNSLNLSPDHIANFTTEEDRMAIVKGVVIDDPVIGETPFNKEKAAFTLSISSLYSVKSARFTDTAGIVRVYLYGQKINMPSCGDEVIMEGVLSRPAGLKNPGIFDYSNYLKVKNVYSVLKVKDPAYVKKISAGKLGRIRMAAYAVRHNIMSCLDRHFDKEYAGFLKAILVGDRSDLKNSLKEDFVKTGTVHVIAISGLNIGLICAGLLAVFGALRIPKKFNLILTAVISVFYAVVVGSEPPIVRAVVMFVIFVIGYLMSRESDSLNSLSAAAFLILLWNPKALFDVSFQLSFISIASIIILTPPIDKFIGIDAIDKASGLAKIRHHLLKGVSVSLAAWLGSWPFIVSYFNIVSVISIIANLIIIPILFILTAGSFLLLLMSLISACFTNAIAYVMEMTEKILFYINHWLAGLPFAYFRINAPSVEFSSLYYLGLLLLILPKRKIYYFIIFLILFNILVWKDIIYQRKDIAEITFLDVGRGDSAFIRLPKGETVLIDGGQGQDEEGFNAAKSVIAPYLWNKNIDTIDMVIVTHFHADHVGGIPYILKNFKIGLVVDSGTYRLDSGICREYMKIIKDKKIRHISPGEGDILNIDGAKFFVLNPPKDSTASEENENSLVLKMSYKNFNILFCGDIANDALDRLTMYDDFLKSDVLKVPHHGGRIGDERVVKRFFLMVSPKISVISAGKDAGIKTRSDNIMNNITYSNVISYETSKDGAVVLVIDDGGIQARPYILNKN